jgi:hypothetical protein
VEDEIGVTLILLELMNLPRAIDKRIKELCKLRLEIASLIASTVPREFLLLNLSFRQAPNYELYSIML